MAPRRGAAGVADRAVRRFRHQLGPRRDAPARSGSWRWARRASGPRTIDRGRPVVSARMPEPGFRRAITTIRGGLALGAVAAVLLAIAPAFDLVAGASSDPGGGVYVAGVGASVSLAALALPASSILAAIALRLLWLHLARRWCWSPRWRSSRACSSSSPASRTTSPRTPTSPCAAAPGRWSPPSGSPSPGWWSPGRLPHGRHRGAAAREDGPHRPPAARPHRPDWRPSSGSWAS